MEVLILKLGTITCDMVWRGFVPFLPVIVSFLMSFIQKVVATFKGFC